MVHKVYHYRSPEQNETAHDSTARRQHASRDLENGVVVLRHNASPPLGKAMCRLRFQEKHGACNTGHGFLE
jgi:hypothetical protein